MIRQRSVSAKIAAAISSIIHGAAAMNAMATPPLFQPGHSTSARSDHSSQRSQLLLNSAFATSREGVCPSV